LVLSWKLSHLLVSLLLSLNVNKY